MNYLSLVTWRNICEQWLFDRNLRKYYQITKEGIERINVFIYEWPNVTRAYDFIKEAVKNDE